MCDGCGPKASLQDVLEALNAGACVGRIQLLGQHFGDSGSEELANALRASIERGTCKTHSIYLMNNDIKDNGLIAILQALKGNKTVTSLNFNGNKVGNDGARALADYVRVEPTIQNVYLMNNPVGNDGIDALSSAKQDIPTVQLFF